ncbi:hypothetical protein HA402_001416 [Bradysia odoriphaga]|nr:hypothetical protein HA402_001416 [Bradysia odoriphaga]
MSYFKAEPIRGPATTTIITKDNENILKTDLDENTIGNTGEVNNDYQPPKAGSTFHGATNNVSLETGYSSVSANTFSVSSGSGSYRATNIVRSASGYSSASANTLSVSSGSGSNRATNSVTSANGYSSVSANSCSVNNSHEVNNDFVFQKKAVGTDALNTMLEPVKKKIRITKIQNFVPKGIQTDFTGSDIDLLFKNFQESVEERNELFLKMATMVIDFEYFKENNKKTLFYTGFPTWSLLSKFFEMIKEFLPHHFNCKLSRFQMVALTLMKLRLNLSFTDLGYRFRVDETTASRYFYRCIFILYKLFKNSKLVHWPDERQNLLLNVPSYFRSAFKEKITIIVDCFENFIEKSSVLRAAAQGFSFYKHHETLKYLIGISVTGVILFVSIGFGGRASDKEVVRLSGFLDKIVEGDVVLGDKGFLIKDEIEVRNAFLKRPSFVKKGSQLHPTEVEQSRDYARIRIHVERVICILRGKFNICADVVQLSTVAKQDDLFDRDLYDQIIFICSCLVNICPSVVTNYFEM